MSKKAKTKQTPQVSPEKYIRQKSRNLPIYKCWISSDWEKERFANIIIARKHTNGNVTACAYLADLACLGVKDTNYFFNVLPEKLEDKLLGKEIEFDEISYPLAHNIIYAALEYADEYGFEPHKNFTQTTSFFLEEDTDDIPLMEIECGSKEDGKPFYINAGHDSPARAKQIIAQLEKTAGEGNYNFIIGKEDLEDDDDDDDYEEDEDDDDNYDEIIGADFEEGYAIIQELSELNKEEQKSLFFELTKKNEKNPSVMDFKKWTILTTMMAMDIVDQEAIDEYMDVLEQDLDYSVVGIEELPNSLFVGIQDKDSEEVCDLFDEMLEALDDSAKKAKKAIAKFRDEMGDIPVAAYMELLFLENNNKKEAVKKLEEYHIKYPNYFLIQLKWYIHSIDSQEDIFQKDIALKKLKTLLSKSSQAITDYELEVFIACYMAFFVLLDNDHNKIDALTKIIAFEKFLFDNDFLISKDAHDELMSFIFIAKTSALADFFTNGNT